MVYIIVLNWNGVDDTINCLKSLISINLDCFTILVCDNGSTDESVSNIKQWGVSLCDNQSSTFTFSCSNLLGLQDVTIVPNKKNIILVEIGKNLGYAGGNNIGLELARAQEDCDAVWVLNNDTEVDEYALKNIMEAHNIHGDGIYGSKLVYYEDKKTIQGLGGIINKYLCTTKHYLEGEDSDISIQNEIVAKNIDYIIGASFYITKSVLKDVGIFSEDYFLYFEEIDYCMRARKFGYRIYPVSNSVVYHKEGASTKKMSKGVISDYFSIKNRLVVSQKFFQKFYFIVYLSLTGVLINRLVRGEWGKAKNVVLILIGKDVYPIEKLMK